MLGLKIVEEAQTLKVKGEGGLIWYIGVGTSNNCISTNIKSQRRSTSSTNNKTKKGSCEAQAYI